ncbi:Demethylmenaquinone methyltransferase [Quillaja saponaria]|uniref:Demethylmenaquinone methyltransferase n=1 Tax=Quillaja saponaria TaxID=32244 RepID=A0AAD7QI09_QUISA|nr:Demethylmenaquinone methyltransferase [Quillaja saponaria]
MGKSTNRDWTQIYAIYGMDKWTTLVFLLCQAILFSILSVLYLLYFNPICVFFERLLPIAAVPSISARFAAGFIGSVTALSAVCLFLAAANFFYSSVPLHYNMAQRMVSAVNDWSTVKLVLDLGCCGRGILLNTVATQLKKEGEFGSGSRVGPIQTDYAINFTNRKDGGRKEYGHRTVEASAERMRVMGELVRVLKVGGVGVVWDLQHVHEYVRRLQELKMEEIRVSERVTAFMVSSHIVSFRKPSQHVLGTGEVRLEWRIC